jgi:hypothetical protein
MAELQVCLTDGKELDLQAWAVAASAIQRPVLALPTKTLMVNQSDASTLDIE